MAKGQPVARGQGWTDRQWRDFERSGYDESTVRLTAEQRRAVADRNARAEVRRRGLDPNRYDDVV